VFQSILAGRECEEISINALEIAKGGLSGFKFDWFAMQVPTNTAITKPH